MTDHTIHMGLAGRFRLRVRRPDGSVKTDTGWFRNLILNSGLDYIGSFAPSGNPSQIAYCAVGSGTSAVTADQTALVSEVARTSSISTSETISAASEAPYYWSVIKHFRFSAGGATGNLGEVGCSAFSSAASGNLFNRALITDSEGNPTTITVLSDETLDVDFEFRVYPATADVSSTVTISGTDYATVTRPAGVSSITTSQWTALGDYAYLYAVTSYVNSYSGGIGGITGSPSGTSLGSATSGSAPTAYVPGSYAQVLRLSWSISAATSSIGSILVRTGLGAWQIGFTPVLPKTNANVLTLDVKFTWANYSAS